MKPTHTPGTLRLCIALIACCLSLCDIVPAYAQADSDEIVQLTDEHLSPIGSWPGGFTEFNESTFFGLNSELRGLWKTDGTKQGTVLVKDLFLLPDSLVHSGTFLYFVTSFVDSPPALWRSDGTEAGTIKLLEVETIDSESFVFLGNTMYFVATASTQSDLALWRTDGTVAGTEDVTDLMALGDDVDGFELLSDNNVLYIATQAGGTPASLWQSDGTREGTQLILNTPQSPRMKIATPGTLYFLGTDEAHGEELWRYDSATGEPQLVSDIRPGPDGSDIFQPVTMDQKLFFVANDGDGLGLWTSDGTTAGTRLVKEVDPILLGAPCLRVVDDQLYLVAGNEDLQRVLWTSDGTELGTKIIKDIGVESGSQRCDWTELHGILYFFGTDEVNTGLWRSDGTEVGTFIVQAPLDGVDVTAANETLYFAGPTESDGLELWTSDGTTESTRVVKDVDPNHTAPGISMPVPVHNRVYFSRPHGDGSTPLWMSAATPVGTNVLPQDPAVRIGEEIEPVEWAAVGNYLFISATDQTGPGLWTHDGASLELVQRFTEQGPTALFPQGNELLFSASNRVTINGPIHDLWRSDGTAAGTSVLAEGNSANVEFIPQTVFGGRLYASQQNTIWVFDASLTEITHFAPAGLQRSIASMVDAQHALYIVVGDNLDNLDTVAQTVWRSDGTPEGTVQLLSDGLMHDSSQYVATNDGLFFRALNEDFVPSLWYNRKSSPNLVQLAAAAPGQYAYLNSLTLLNDQLFFVMNDGEHGTELWQSDGTVRGTTLVKDIGSTDTDGVHPFLPLFVFENRLYFSADEGVHGQELWQSDGTADGTVLFADINSTATGSAPQEFLAAADRFYFSAHDASHGRELWQSQGTPETTMLVSDLYPGRSSSDAQPLIVMNNLLYFTADNGVDGEQLFALRSTGSTPLLPNRVHLPLIQTGE